MAAKTILVVDDDPAIHDLLRAMLDPARWRLESALSGGEAVSLLEAGTPDLVLTDIVMPGMDGIALLKWIADARPELRAVVMTAVNTPANVLGSIRERAFALIAKPFTREALLDTLRAALEAEGAADDIAILSARPEWVSLEVRCRLSVADRLIQFFSELNADLQPEDRERVSLAFRELLINAIEHGGHSDPAQKLTLTYIRGTRCVLYIIRDPGVGFSFDTLSHAAVSNQPGRPLEHADVRSSLGIRPGGFGILLTRQFADEVVYNEKGNEVVLIKYLPGDGQRSACQPVMP